MLSNKELAVFSLLGEQNELHGYQIEQLIEQRGMRNWTEIGFSSIYHILNKLEKQGWVTSRIIPVEGKPARKAYAITSDGEKRLHDEVLSRLTVPRPHSADFELALANLALLAPEEIDTAIQKNLELLRGRLQEMLNTWEKQKTSYLPPHVDMLFDYSSVLMMAQMGWLEDFAAKNAHPSEERP